MPDQLEAKRADTAILNFVLSRCLLVARGVAEPVLFD